ncbi:YhcN/YlaJ family sporulation lipoprotein [Paenalkalicoccus suaedae]|uniref:YhcN/YlaJ family sporulation lipoprotein n=1 Tax=Paenalkalicoccus suaedae TaxID=2592382 RepID=A0A859FHS5_9BACI|nr:YhcN/YlaJ family sporulation lipoprotein [Paenalkalicoccus suaedae]QKS72192.1 YhcN/YlaJ family sporulation lipoprotein [Paenalkalicoccus suaedae]
MKKQSMMLLPLLLLAACGNESGFPLFNQDGDNPIVMNVQDSSNGDPLQFGYTSNTKQEAKDGEGIPGYFIYDRSLLAESIGEMTAMLEDVEEASVLITDDDCLIVYDQGEGMRYDVAEQVYQTALSVLPSYYNIYISDDAALRSDIERFEGNVSLDDAQHNSLDQTIERMKDSPQGH